MSTTRFVNLGRVANSGHELQLNTTPVDRDNVKLTLDVTGSFLSNKLEKLGGVPPIFFNGSRQRHQEGYPLGGLFQRKYTYQDKNGDGIISRVGCTTAVGNAGNTPECELTLGDTSSAAQYIGPVLPTREFGVTPTLTVFKALRLGARVQYRGGNFVYNNTEEFRCTASSIRNCRAINDPTAPLADQAAAMAYTLGTTSAGYIEKGDYVKLREVSATYTLPKRLIGRTHLGGASFSLAGRNLATWTDYKGFDPEVNAASAAGFSQFDFLTQPRLRMWTLRVDANF